MTQEISSQVQSYSERIAQITGNGIFKMDVEKNARSWCPDAQNINKVFHYSKSRERQRGAARQMEAEKRVQYIFIDMNQLKPQFYNNSMRRK